MFEDKILNRRALLSGAAVAGLGVALAGCTAAQIQSAQAAWASVAGQIQSTVATAAQYVPTIESIASVAASLFGPQYAVLVQVGSAAFNQIVATLTSVVSNLTPPAAQRLAARLGASSPNVPVTIGTTPAHVTVIGWRAG